MKKLLLLALSFGLLMSCKKDDENGIPPVDPNKPQPEKPQDKPATALEVKNLKAADYEKFRDSKEKVKLHGEIAEVTNGRSYFKFSDGTLVQIFTPTFKDLKEETSQKLKTVGQELTVVGVFTDYKLKDGTLVKEILYDNESNLTFGKTPEAKPEQPAVALEAATAKVNDYQDGKAVKLHGNIVIEGNKSYFKFSDNTLIQIYATKKAYDALSENAKAKLQIAGQEVTIVGKFKDFTKDGVLTREILYEKESDLTFGKTPEVKPAPKPEQPAVALEAATATVNDFKAEKVVKLHGNITVQTEGKYKRSYFKFSDGTLIQFYVKGYTDLPQEVRTKLETEGQEVTVKGTFNTFTRTDKKTNKKTEVRQIVYTSAADLTF